MQEHSKYAVGIDVGTNTVRCVVAAVDENNGAIKVVGVGSAPNSGMRKGVVVNISGPARAIDDALAAAERMSGHQIEQASVSINGAHMVTTHADGMVAAGSNPEHTITPEDVARIEEVATVGKIPANREILDVVPHAYTLDGQGGIKNPVGMVGTRLEVDAHVISALTPSVAALQGALDSAKVLPSQLVPAGVAAARSVLSEQQMEQGVALVDIGAGTTNVTIYEEGDLQYVGVVPLGGNNITNDIAIGMKIEPDLAEQIKREHGSGLHRHKSAGASVKHNGEIINVQTDELDEIVEARLEEIFEGVQAELKKAGRAKKLPAGIVLCGGTAKLKGLHEFAKEQLQLAVQIGKTTGYGGVATDGIDAPDFATAVGLMQLDANFDGTLAGPKLTSGGGLNLKKLIQRFRP